MARVRGDTLDRRAGRASQLRRSSAAAGSVSEAARGTITARRLFLEVRRQDLHAMLVEGVLDLGVQTR